MSWSPSRRRSAEGTVVLDDVEARRHEAEEYLAPISAALRSQGVNTAWAIRRGRPADEILAAAQEGGADLIAMATHGRTGVGRLLFGSVAEAVLRRATVPVFMIRVTSHRARRRRPPERNPSDEPSRAPPH